jgi:hypothetical protein
MEINFKQQLADMVEASELNYDQKELWKLFMMKSIPEEDEAVYEAVSESSENLELLTKHLRDKIMSLDNLKDDGWKEVTKDEKEYVGDIEEE